MPTTAFTPAGAARFPQRTRAGRPLSPERLGLSGWPAQIRHRPGRDGYARWQAGHHPSTGQRHRRRPTSPHLRHVHAGRYLAGAFAERVGRRLTLAGFLQPRKSRILAACMRHLKRGPTADAVGPLRTIAALALSCHSFPSMAYCVLHFFPGRAGISQLPLAPDLGLHVVPAPAFVTIAAGQ
jgi:hypothetical protein